MSLYSFFKHPEQRRLILTGMLGFAVIGALQSLYGPIFPNLIERFGLSPEAVGLIVSSHFIGAVLVIVSGGLSLKLLGYRKVLVIGSLCMTAGCLGVALSPSWTLSLVAAFIGGLGFGTIEVAGNLLFTRSFGREGTGVLNLVHAMFGVGAVVGPLAIALVTPRISLAFIILSVICLVLAILHSRISEPEPMATQKKHLTFPIWGLTGFALMYFLYVAGEVGVASWESSHLTPFYGEARAAFFTSFYWGALTIGRLLMSLFSTKLPAKSIVLASSLTALAGLLLAHSVPLAPLAYALTGLAFAPFFPTGLIWLQSAFPERSEQIAPFILAIANAGAIVSPPLVGVIVGMGSSQTIPTALAALVLLLVIVTAALHFSLKR